MRHILQEIFERYLNSEQAAFDTSPRELWPSKQPGPQPQDQVDSGDDDEPTQFDDVYPWLEPQS